MEMAEELQYIQLNQEVISQDFTGRFTKLYEGSYGAILDEESIPTLWDISEKQKNDLLVRLKTAKEHGHVLAIVAGYPCSLAEDQFVKKAPVSSIVPWEIII